jgi:tRNA modification GTPase
MHADDTIVAVSSASGPAARMIVRTSGPTALAAARKLSADVPGGLIPSGTAVYARLAYSDLVCPAWVYLFPGPRSYTGDDLVEYHVPGNPILARLLVAHLEAGGLRPAEPGEFTARAYFNGRIDLTEAEGVAATIAAGSEQELAAARRLMAGELTRRLVGPTDAVAEALALLEVGIDFSEEDVSFLSAGDLRARAAAAAGTLRELLADAPRFEQLSHEPTFVLVGRPNAGKSTLFNALAGYERAVASPVAGTTRDALSAVVALARGQVRVVDVAGLEPPDGVVPVDGGSSESGDNPLVADAADPHVGVRRRMRATALRAVAEADFVVMVRSPEQPAADAAEVSRPPDLVVVSKLDLARPRAGPAVGAEAHTKSPTLYVSAVTGDNMEALRVALDRLAFGRGGSEARLALTARHVAAVEEAVTALDRAAAAAAGPCELAAVELRAALDALGRVSGRVSPDELLGRIFGQFCIGK